jgi:cytochrome c1
MASDGRVPDRVLLMVFFLPNYLGHPTTTSKPTRWSTPAAHRAGMVFPAVLRDPARHHLAQVGTLYYFAFFLVIMPILGLIETPRRLPNSITEAVLEKNGAKTAPQGAQPATSKPRAESAPADKDFDHEDFPQGADRAWTGTGPEPPWGQAAEYPIHEPIEQSWSFAGPFGTYNKGQLQRGFKVYREACAACHGLNRVAFRNMAALGYTEAAGYRAGQPNTRSRTGRIPTATCSCARPFPRTASRIRSPIRKRRRPPTMAPFPPDLSLIAKARAAERGFPRFVFDIFTQYEAKGSGLHLFAASGLPGPAGWLRAAAGDLLQPLFPRRHLAVHADALPGRHDSYNDGTPETIHQYARDVSAF